MAAASRCLARDRRRRIGDGDLEGDGGIPGGAITGVRANARVQRRIEAAAAAAPGNLPHAAPRPCSFAAAAPPLLLRLASRRRVLIFLAGQGASGDRGHQWPAALHRLAEGSRVGAP
ncbi:unnamed protein product [Urochloa humidicola]